MKETPIIMQGWGVRAVQADLKTQTRRVVWPQPAGIPRWRCGLNSLDGKHGGLWESTDKCLVAPTACPATGCGCGRLGGRGMPRAVRPTGVRWCGGRQTAHGVVAVNP